MKILFLVPYTPTLIRTRPYNLLRGLARRGNDVTLATLWENETERAALKHLEDEGIRVISARLTKARAFWNMLRALPTNLPLQAVYCWEPGLMCNLQFAICHPELIEGRNSQFDLIHVEHLRGARYGMHLQSATLAPHASAGVRHLPFAIPVVWDSVDCISHLFEQAARDSRSPFGRIITRLELARTRRYEAMLVNHFDRVLVTSPVDKAALEQLANQKSETLAPHAGAGVRNQKLVLSEGEGSEISVLPNGVDLEYFGPSTTPCDPYTIVFTGKMSYHANVTAALHLVNDIMPLVWRARPDVRVQIVGQNPPRRLRDLVTQHATRITVTGSVPDLRPYLQRAAVAVAPIPYGAGIQNKVLEALACATPVVATPQAVSALQVTDGEHLLLGDRAEAFARQVLRLLEDAQLHARVGAAGRKFVEQNHDWDKIVERLEDIYHETINRLTD